MDDDKLREQVENKYDQLRTERDKWEPGWKELRDNIDPDTGRFPNEEVNAGKRKDSKIINNTAGRSSMVLSAGMHSGMTSPARPWFELATPDPELTAFGPVKTWLSQCQSAMRETFIRSNLYNVLPTCYGEEGTFGCGVIAAVPDDKTLVRFHNFTIGSYCLATSSRGIVDTLYREFSMTPRQMLQQFGKAKLSDTVKVMLSRNDEAWVEICHCIEPNANRETGKMDNANMPYRSVYWEKGSDRRTILKKSGFNKYPIFAPRWKVTGENVYGKGPGSTCIGEVLALQRMEMRKAELLEKGVRPPMTAPASMRGTRVSILPGDVTWVPDAELGAKFAPVYTVDSSWLGQLRAEIEASEGAIKETYYEDLFLMISNLDSVRTATEIATRKEEKMLMLGPVLERQNDELLDPLIDYTFQAMLDQSLPIWMGMKQGKPLLPPPPRELAGMDLAVQYVSVLAQAQKALNIGSIERAIGFVGNLAAAFPAAADSLNVDEAVAEYFKATGVPPSMVNSPDQIAAIRQQKAEAAQAAQQQQQMQQVIAGAKMLSETDTGGDNALTQLEANA